MTTIELTIGKATTLETANTGAIIVLVPEGFAKKPTSSKIPQVIASQIESACNDGDFNSKAGSCLLLRRLAELKSPRLLLIGVGELAAKDMAASSAVLLKKCREMKIKKATVSLTLLPKITSKQAEKLISGILLAAYQYRFTKSVEEDDVLEKCAIQLTGADKAILEQAMVQGHALVHGVNLARELGNLPSNIATPTFLAETARQMGKDYKNISVQIKNEKEIEKLRMGAFLSVAKGTDEAPKLIVLQYQGAGKDEPPVALVGKGITFDSGGISLKPGAGMDEMKFDMCGAASVLGVFKTLGELQPKVNVVGVIASCENMPSGRATKPGDVVTSMSGQTIEVLNTDAEGRLILCDALTFAAQFKPKSIIDIATLTGACVIALGGVNSGLFSNQRSLEKELFNAGQESDDHCWPLPLNTEYDEQLKSNFADIANIGGREAGAVTAAMFLQRFVKGQKWAHLDIAGTAWLSGAKKGATGRPVPLLVQYLMNQSAKK